MNEASHRDVNMLSEHFDESFDCIGVLKDLQCSRNHTQVLDCF